LILVLLRLLESGAVTMDNEDVTLQCRSHSNSLNVIATADADKQGKVSSYVEFYDLQQEAIKRQILCLSVQ